MSTENLTSYMKDHAAGATAAMDLLDHLISTHADTIDEDFFKQLRVEIDDDKATLDEILSRFEAVESTLRNTVTRVGEKLARAKFLLAGPAHGELGRLEALEMLSLGIEGKRVLWLALEAAAIPELQTTNLPSLITRAAGQRERVEQRRLDAARHALSDTPEPPGN